MICHWDRNDINNFFSFIVVVVVVSLLMRDNFFFAMKLFDYFVFATQGTSAAHQWCLGPMIPFVWFHFHSFCCFVTFSHCLCTLLDHSFAKDWKTKTKTAATHEARKRNPKKRQKEKMGIFKEVAKQMTLNKPTWQIIIHNRANSRDNFRHLRGHTTNNPSTKLFHSPFLSLVFNFNSFVLKNWIFCYRQNIYRIGKKAWKLSSIFSMLFTPFEGKQLQTTATHIRIHIVQIQETENEHKSVYGNVYECVLSVPQYSKQFSLYPVQSTRHNHTCRTKRFGTFGYTYINVACWTERVQTSNMHTHAHTPNCGKRVIEIYFIYLLNVSLGLSKY